MRIAAGRAAASEPSPSRDYGTSDAVVQLSSVESSYPQSLQRSWVLLMMGVLFCCGAGFFIRRRMYPSPLSDEPVFNVSFTRQPVTLPVAQQPGSMQGFGVNGVTGCDQGITMTHPIYPAQPGSAHMMMGSYPLPPAYCNHPPPPYEQIFHDNDKK
ncbi:hypothetical protein LDENG_00052250 [Lucifuga dentata]|nr:hypothetical protein LDENG_00052250 [Lucifuga dentata]